MDSEVEGAAAAVFTWGRNYCGQLGQGNNADCTTPRLVARLARKAPSAVFCGVDATVVATGTQHDPNLLSQRSHLSPTSGSGSLHSFGYGTNGKLGHGNEETSYVPRRWTTPHCALIG